MTETTIILCPRCQKSGFNSESIKRHMCRGHFWTNDSRRRLTPAELRRASVTTFNSQKMKTICEACGGTGKISPIVDETQLGQTPGSADYSCPHCTTSLAMAGEPSAEDILNKIFPEELEAPQSLVISSTCLAGVKDAIADAVTALSALIILGEQHVPAPYKPLKERHVRDRLEKILIEWRHLGNAAAPKEGQ